MTKKLYHVRAGYYYEYTGICKSKEENLTTNEVCDLLNKQSDKITEQAIQIDFLKDENKHMKQVLEENKQLKKEQNKVQKVLTDYFNRYTQMAVELRSDKYGNSVCHDVTEVIMEIADKLDINILEW